MKQRTNIPWDAFVKHWRTIRNARKAMKKLAEDYEGTLADVIFVGPAKKLLVGSWINGAEVFLDPDLNDNGCYALALDRYKLDFKPNNDSYRTKLSNEWMTGVIACVS